MRSEEHYVHDMRHSDGVRRVRKISMEFWSLQDVLRLRIIAKGDLDQH